MALPRHKTDLRKFCWEATKRPQISGRIKLSQLERALDLHIEGRYEDAISAVEKIPVSDRTAEAWRIIGHSQHGLDNLDAALEAHMRARDLHAHDVVAVAEDEINISAVFIAMKKYDDAWKASERARELSPESIMHLTPKISVLNHQKRHGALRSLLTKVAMMSPRIFDNPIMIDHLKNDLDFIGVSEMVEEIRSEFLRKRSVDTNFVSMVRDMHEYA